jgi:hypothetical protein
MNYEEAVAEVERELASAKVNPRSPAAVAALTEAASQYAVEDRPRRDEWWFPAAFDFLVGLGADADEARAMRSISGVVASRVNRRARPRRRHASIAMTARDIRSPM